MAIVHFPASWFNYMRILRDQQADRVWALLGGSAPAIEGNAEIGAHSTLHPQDDL